MGTRELQDEIRTLLSQIGKSQVWLAGELYYAGNPGRDDDLEFKKYVERVKKQLQRSGTKPELLNYYIKFISNHEDVKNRVGVLPHYASTRSLSSRMEEKLKAFSSSIVVDAE
ncbi:hypothetical protein DFR27_0664 [Umboniibacter marinipuniceus]|uniref:Uncharacterized protein n=1 Tax=Umboniibacter marinipuniceus TaxID=569599 RepID=A0A3M0ADX8_9GAMM|nr:hypothetical protein DFR27_0664 [Umboniibacter marinipuniceus]